MSVEGRGRPRISRKHAILGIAVGTALLIVLALFARSQLGLATNGTRDPTIFGDTGAALDALSTAAPRRHGLQGIFSRLERPDGV